MVSSHAPLEVLPRGALKRALGAVALLALAQPELPLPVLVLAAARERVLAEQLHEHLPALLVVELEFVH